MKNLTVPAMCALLLGAAGCACPKCAIDTMDDVGVSEIRPPGSGDRGALASIAQLLYATVGVERPEVRAVDSAIASDLLVLGFFVVSPKAPDVRGYALMKDGRICLDVRLVRGAPQDSGYLAHSRVWPLIPFLYAAGHRLARGGTWEASIRAAREAVVDIAAVLEAGETDSALPAGTDAADLARYLRRWSRIR